MGTKGPLKDQVFRIFDGDNSLGRQGSPDSFPDTDKGISRHHATLNHTDGDFNVQPTKDENPTRVNDEVVDGYMPIKNGDEIGMGGCTFLFRTLWPG